MDEVPRARLRRVVGRSAPRSASAMDEVFRALADPTRRNLLILFCEDGQSLSALEGRLPMTRFE